jgi:hypothetical protein
VTLQHIISLVNRVDLGPFVRIDVVQRSYFHRPDEVIEFEFRELVPVWAHRDRSPWDDLRQRQGMIAFARQDFEIKQCTIMEHLEVFRRMRDEDFFNWFTDCLNRWALSRLEESMEIRPTDYVRPAPRGRSPAMSTLNDILQRQSEPPYSRGSIDPRNPYRSGDEFERMNWFIQEFERRNTDTTASTDVQQAVPSIEFEWNEDELDF